MNPIYSIKTRLLIGFILMVLVPSLIIAAVSAVGALQGSRAQILEQLASVATLKQTFIETWLDDLQAGLRDVHHHPDVQRAAALLAGEWDPARAEAARAVLRTEMKARRHFAELYLIDLDGRKVVSTDPEEEGYRFRRKRFFGEGLKAPYNQILAYSVAQHYNWVIVVRPFRGPGGETLGVLGGRAGLAVIDELLAERSGLGGTGETYIVGRDHIVLSRLRFGEGGKMTTPPVDRVLSTGARTAGLSVNYQDVPVFGVYHWIPDLEVVLVAERSRKEAYGPTYRLLAFNSVVALSLVIGAVAAALLVTRGISGPIAQLARTATRIADGDLNRTVVIHQQDEIGVLADAFNRMTAQLRHLIDRLEQRAAELEEKNRELERMDRLKDEFVANTSHELKTPLNGMVGLAESLVDHPGEPLPDFVRTNLRMIASSGRRLDALINDMLDFSRLRNRELTLSLGVINLRGAAERVLALCEPLVDRKPVSLINDIPADLPPAEADENRVQQILYNLVGNAIKFTDQGRITVSAQKLSDGPEGIAMIEISVADTGIGIAPEEQSRVFQSFEQADGSIARKYGGTGIGLAITRRLTELHGGTIGVTSTPGEGSRFVFTLPVAGASAHATAPDIHPAAIDAPIPRPVHPDTAPGAAVVPATDSPADDRAPTTVLVVDDEPVNLQVLINFLSPRYRVRRASDGGEALDALEAGPPPDLILLDVMMPGLSGYDVTRKVRERYTADQLPIILLTAKNGINDVVTGFSAGANDYLAKPVAGAELLTRIQTHLAVVRLKRETVEMMVQNRAAEAAYQEKSRFLAGMSHELRSPLNAILGFSRMIAEAPGISDDIQAAAETIQRNGEHLLALINQVLDFSRVEAGRIELTPRDIDLSDLLDDLKATFSLKAREKELSLHAAPPPDLPSAIRVDDVKLRQILINLLDNAVKFTRNGWVSFGMTVAADPDPAASDESLIIHAEVADSGPGIDPHEMDRLFTAFGQTESGRRSGQGTGLGLYVTRQIVRKMGGELTAESRPGEGTRLRFHIRAERGRTVPAKAAAPRRIIGLLPGQPRRRLLIVDAAADNRALMIQWLRPLQFEVREAATTDAALRRLDGWTPDLIILEVRLSAPEGLDAVRRIRAAGRSGPPVLIGVSAAAGRSGKEAAAAAGCAGLLPKPMTEEQLLDCLHKHLGLEYQYESAPPPVQWRSGPEPDLSDALFARVPRDLLGNLHAAARKADMVRVDRRIEEIRSHAPDLADRLAHLAWNFDYMAIEGLLDRMTELESASDPEAWNRG